MDEKFWQELEKRAEENGRLVESGLPEWLAPVVRRLGLSFWKFGAFLTLLITVLLRILAWDTVWHVARGVFL